MDLFAPACGLQAKDSREPEMMAALAMAHRCAMRQAPHSCGAGRSVFYAVDGVLFERRDEFTDLATTAHTVGQHRMQ